MNGEARLTQAWVLGLLVALWVCFDPLFSRQLGIDTTFEAVGIPDFPYVLSISLGGLLVLALLVGRYLPHLWREKDRWAIVFVIAMAQFSGISLGKLDLLEIAIALVMAFWLIQAFVERDREIQLSPVVLFCVGIIFLSILALVNRPPVSGIVAMGEKFVLFFLIVDFLRRRTLIKKAAEVVIWAGCFSAVVAVVQVVIYAVWGMLLTIGAPEVNARAFLKATPFGALPRATGFFPNPASLNDFLLFASAVGLFAVVSAKTWPRRGLYLTAVLSMAVATVLTWSTTSLFGLGVMGALFFYVWKPSLSIQYTGVLIIGTVGAYATGLLEWSYRFLKDYGSASGMVRLDLLKIGAQSLDRNPIVGVGIQNVGKMSGNFFTEGRYVFKYHIHNAFMMMATELGIFGALLFLGIVVYLSIRLLRVLASGPMEEKWVFKGFLLGWVAILVHMQTEPMAYEGALWLIFGLIEGAAIIVLRKSARPWAPAMPEAGGRRIE